MKKLIYLIACAGLLAQSGVFAASIPPLWSEENRVLVFLTFNSAKKIDAPLAEIRKIGAVGSIFYPRMVEAYVAPENRAKLAQIEGIGETFEGEIDP